LDASDEDIVVSVSRTLRLVFGVVPIAAGVDKFLNLLAYWPRYVAPVFARMLPMSLHAFMFVLGLIEILAGLAILLTPWQRAFGYLVAGWLTCIAINLIAGRFFDIAVRDLVMAVSALSFARLSAVVPHARHVKRPLEHARASG
jgi:uncharacterized membrane protein YphA (DoxX/SURF4 family)